MSSVSSSGRPNSSPTASQIPPKKGETHKYMRSIDANFGDRLANARNLAHTEVPPAPPREQNRTSMGYISLEAAKSIREAARIPPSVSRYEWENGSYRSPFDYNIPGHSISGDNITLAQVYLLYPLIRSPAKSIIRQHATCRHRYAAKHGHLRNGN